MADTDVVEHELPDDSAFEPIDWDEYNEPLPFPDGNTRSSAQISPAFLSPPETTRVSDEELVTPPYRSVGRLALRFPGKVKPLQVTATGWVGARRALFTAGHSVYRSIYGGWITKAGFAPRYNNKVEVGYFVKTVYTLQGWIDKGEAEFDLAACVVTREFADKEPPLAVSTDELPALNITTIGYPGRPRGQYFFNGKRMWKCTGEFVGDEDGMRIAVNNLTEGASGGPWYDADANSSDILGLISQVNFEDYDQPVAKSPFFSTGFKNLYERVKDL
jgi:V8-like Glu-specific endopeptidase